MSRKNYNPALLENLMVIGKSAKPCSYSDISQHRTKGGILWLKGYYHGTSSESVACACKTVGIRAFRLTHPWGGTVRTTGALRAAAEILRLSENLQKPLATVTFRTSAHFTRSWEEPSLLPHLVPPPHARTLSSSAPCSFSPSACARGSASGGFLSLRGVPASTPWNFGIPQIR